MSHAIDPFKQPAAVAAADTSDEDEEGGESLEELAAQAAAAGGPSVWFRQLLPDGRAQALFIFIFLATLGGSIYWLVYTVENKWIYALNNPQQVISFQRADTLPAMFSVGMIYSGDSVSDAATLFRSTTPTFHSTFHSASDDSVKTPYVTCNETTLFFPLAFCQPTNANGESLLRPVPGELDGYSAVHGKAPLDLSQWPLFFASTTDKLCLTSHLIVNTSVYNSRFQQDLVPQLGFVPMSAQSALAVAEHVLARIVDPNDPVLLRFVGGLSAPVPVVYNSRVTMTFRATKTVKVDGAVLLDYTYDAGRDVPMTPQFVRSYFTNYLVTTFDTARGIGQQSPEWERMYALYNSTYFDVLGDQNQGGSSNASTQYFVNQLCFVPQTFDIQLVTEVTPYGVVSFLSDLGGFINLVTVALVVLFPLAFDVTKPRTFIVFFLTAKWRARQANKERAKTLAMRKQKAAERGLELSTNPAQEAQEAQYPAPPLSPSQQL